MKDNGMHEHESLDFFKRIVPRNPCDWEGCVILYSTWSNMFYMLAFGSMGCNISDEEYAEGFNDYMMLGSYEVEEKADLAHIITEIRNAGWIDNIPGLVESDGFCWTLKHKEWNNGDIRRFLMEGLNCVGYGVPKSALDGIYRDLIYIGADYDVWHEKKQVKKGAKSK